jgi:hypothetical protein
VSQKHGTEAVEAFARAAARIADPFTDRGLALAEMGMSEAGWRELERRWHEEIARAASGGDRTLADAFAEAFAAERERMRAARAAPPQSGAGSVTLPEGPVDETSAAAPALLPALPFRGQRPSPTAELEPLAGSGGTAIIEALSESEALPWDRKEPR